MLRLVVFLIAVAAAGAGLAWLADRPGQIVIDWEGTQVETTVFYAVIITALTLAAAIILWSILRGVWQSPAAIGNYFNRRREKRGLEALSSGMIAIGAGDKALATRYAIQARKSLPNEPMTHLLRAQAAGLAGDGATSRRIFEAMLSAPDTEQLGLRGLFLEAEKEGETEAARQFAERAVKLNPKLSWPVDALFDLQCRDADWTGALETLTVARKHGHIEKPAADRRRAVLLTAQAQKAEDSDPERAMNLALEAHGLASDLVPAAAIAGRLLSARGSTPKAVKILQKTWRKSPHPDIAVAYAYARLGDSPKDRMQRVAQLAAMSPNQAESPIALANAAIEAKDFGAARKALEPLIESRLTQRVCTLMARIEGEEGKAGGVREWLARAVNAPRDPAWTADGVVADDWGPVSPVTGALDAFQWRVPVEAVEPRDNELLASKIEELVQLGARPETMLAAGAVGGASPTAAATAPAEPAPAAAAPPPQPVQSAKTAEAEDAEVVEIAARLAPEEPEAKTVAQDQPKAEVEVQRTGDAKPTAMTTAPVKEAPPVAANGKAAEPDAPAVVLSDAAKEPAVAAKQDAKPEDVKKPETDEPKEDGGTPAAAAKSVTPAAKGEPKIFVAPRAPDDPGLDGERKPR